MTGGGDRLKAERRLAFGLGLLADGDIAGALDSAAAAVEADPAFASAWFTLAEAAERAGRDAIAIEAYRRYLAVAPDDRLGAIARLVGLKAEATPPSLPPAYVQALFDDYAPRFEVSLVERLGYRGPGLVIAALDRLAGARAQWPRALDLGCGTGLMGRALAGRVARLDGVDLSPAMLAKAEAGGGYRDLEQNDAVAALSGRAARGGHYDLVTAADMLIYLGDLMPLLRGVATVLNADGLFAATLESTGDSENFVLRPTQRYAHSQRYLVACAAAAGLTVALLTAESARDEGAQAVPGLTFVLKKQVSAARRQSCGS